jgi:hypothetical protein
MRGNGYKIFEMEKVIKNLATDVSIMENMRKGKCKD